MCGLQTSSASVLHQHRCVVLICVIQCAIVWFHSRPRAVNSCLEGWWWKNHLKKHSPRRALSLGCWLHGHWCRCDSRVIIQQRILTRATQALTHTPGTPDTVPGFQLALSTAASVYFFRENKKIKLGACRLNCTLLRLVDESLSHRDTHTHDFTGPAVGYTAAGLVFGALFGGLLQNWLRVDIVPIGVCSSVAHSQTCPPIIVIVIVVIIATTPPLHDSNFQTRVCAVACARASHFHIFTRAHVHVAPALTVV